MKRIITLMMALTLLLLWNQAEAQGTRYLDEVFDDVEIETGIQYATNISVLTGAPQPVNLTMDVYTPAGDTEEDRPVMIVLHTGSYLPQYINGQVTGGIQDSSVVNVCKRLARRGYVAVAATYRLGWNPVSPNQDVRTGTLLNAVYRSIQDARSCIRFLRQEEAEGGDPYGIDPENIGLWGIGTGGYIVFASAFLDRYDEIILGKFLNEDLEPYVDDELNGDVYGLNETPLNLPNNSGYSSDFKFGVNMGGALGDTSWIEGDASPIPEPNLVGFHVATDPFAPFGNGPVIVPTTDEFVVNVAGTRTAIGKLNELGGNAELGIALQSSAELPLNTFMTTYMQALSGVPFTGPLGQLPTTLGTEHMYAFIPPPGGGFPIRPESGPWSWHDQATLNAVIAAVNMQLPPDQQLDADELHQNSLATNPDMSAEKGQTHLDSIFAYAMPRACLSFGLSECLTVGTEDVIDPISVDLKLFPNPAVEQLTIQTGFEHPIREVHLFDLGGRMVRSNFNINTATYQLRRENLPSGLYFAKIKLDEGWVVQKLTFK